jgi:hypothetical protein
VLESPFDNLKSVIKHLLKRFHMYWMPFSKEIGIKIAQTHFPSLDMDGIFPENSVNSIPKHIPILIVHSKKDKVIPINSSRKLYVALRESEHHHVHLLELDRGTHGKLMIGPDAQIYQDVVHAFYKKYSLPYHEEFACRGEPLLTLCQPSIAEVKKKIKKKRTLEEFEIE